MSRVHYSRLLRAHTAPFDPLARLAWATRSIEAAAAALEAGDLAEVRARCASAESDLIALEVALERRNLTHDGPLYWLVQDARQAVAMVQGGNTRDSLHDLFVTVRRRYAHAVELIDRQYATKCAA